jgi:hypothetical protein
MAVLASDAIIHLLRNAVSRRNSARSVKKKETKLPKHPIVLSSIETSAEGSYRLFIKKPERGKGRKRKKESRSAWGVGVSE